MCNSDVGGTNQRHHSRQEHLRNFLVRLFALESLLLHSRTDGEPYECSLLSLLYRCDCVCVALIAVPCMEMSPRVDGLKLSIAFCSPMPRGNWPLRDTLRCGFVSAQPIVDKDFRVIASSPVWGGTQGLWRQIPLGQGPRAIGRDGQ